MSDLPVTVDVVETVELHTVEHRCHVRWHQRGTPAWDQRYVRVGQVVATGRWYVELVAQVTRPARLYGTEQEAYLAAQRVMSWLGPNWVQIDCYPTAAAVPEARRRARGRAAQS